MTQKNSFYKVTHKGCAWFKGKHGTPDLTKCKTCLHRITCLGKNYMNWKIRRISDGYTWDKI
jgi:hypothetical protein